MSKDELLYDPIDIQPIPAGTYSAHVAKAELVKAKSGVEYVSCEIQIIQGSQQGKTVSINFHIHASDSRFRQDSRRKFTKLLSCCGIDNATSSSLNLVCEKPFLVEIGETRDSFGDTNCILGFEKLRGS